jgi:glycosyltransferase involved in cell wall biosynthesis
VTPYAVSSEFKPREDVEGERVTDILTRYGIDQPFILSLGRIEPRKNLTALLQAFENVVKRGQITHTLVIAGSVDPLFAKFHTDLLSRYSSASMQIRFTGPIAQEHIATLYRAADLFVYPSFAEGFGLPVLEAMACGAPVIASNTTSIPEVTGTDGAELIDPRNPQALANVMATLLCDADRRSKLGRAALARSQTFSWKRCAEQTLAVYGDLIK